MTGAAAGLGAGIAASLARNGFESVAITYRQTSPEATLSAVAAAGAQAHAVQIDFLDDPARTAATLADVQREYGPFDTLVHGVGPLRIERFINATLASYDEMFDGNVRSAVLLLQQLLPSMRERRFGRCVFFGMTGSAATAPTPAFGLHLAAKSALCALVRTIALEEAAHGITLNLIEPGDIREKSQTRECARRQAAANPRGVAGSYEDIADAVRFLVAVERDFITGAVLAIGAGLQPGGERIAPSA